MDYHPSSEPRPHVPVVFQAAFAYDESGNCSCCGCPWLGDQPNDRTPHCDEACDCHS